MTERELQKGGMMIAGLYVPPIGFYGFPHIGEDLWGPSADVKLRRLRSLGENWDDRREFIKSLSNRH